MKTNHMLLCASLVIVGAILLSSGAGAVAFLPVVLCMAMMGATMWFMMRPGGHDRSDR
jgi:hypothetical protein